MFYRSVGALHMSSYLFKEPNKSLQVICLRNPTRVCKHYQDTVHFNHFEVLTICELTTKWDSKNLSDDFWSIFWVYSRDSGGQGGSVKWLQHFVLLLTICPNQCSNIWLDGHLNRRWAKIEKQRERRIFTVREVIRGPWCCCQVQATKKKKNPSDFNTCIL